ncbi:helix-turn-helix domain-containing protein [Neobacillus jeddahensis]|uniref:helix-turn-helix domain-containing protein n=1 Tax=Neobacillus jeddahensis TaxID=1461580 RepID=UPI000693EA48|nr:helix-turn-helix transcriptional regulator [Neobacillus jeddahensis]
MSLSEKIKELREKQNWSQDTLAKMMKMHRSTLSRYETGKAIPSYQTVIQLAEIFKIDKDYLVGELEQQFPTTGATGYILKEKLEDPAIGMILKLLQQEPELQKALVDLHLMPPKRRRFYADTIITFIKVNNKHKDKM